MWFEKTPPTPPTNSDPSDIRSLRELCEDLRSAHKRLQGEIDDLDDRFRRFVGRQAMRDKVDKERANETAGVHVHESNGVELSPGEKLRLARQRSAQGR